MLQLNLRYLSEARKEVGAYPVGDTHCLPGGRPLYFFPVKEEGQLALEGSGGIFLRKFKDSGFL
jgi:hypothetical protein